jgi:hypothetical protein
MGFYIARVINRRTSELTSEKSLIINRLLELKKGYKSILAQIVNNKRISFETVRDSTQTLDDDFCEIIELLKFGKYKPYPSQLVSEIEKITVAIWRICTRADVDLASYDSIFNDTTTDELSSQGKILFNKIDCLIMTVNRLST